MTYDDAVLSDFDVASDSGSFNDAVRTDVDVVAYFHGVVVEVTSVCLVRWSIKLLDSAHSRRVHR